MTAIEEMHAGYALLAAWPIAMHLQDMLKGAVVTQVPHLLCRLVCWSTPRRTA